MIKYNTPVINEYFSLSRSEYIKWLMAILSLSFITTFQLLAFHFVAPSHSFAVFLSLALPSRIFLRALKRDIFKRIYPPYGEVKKIISLFHHPSTVYFTRKMQKNPNCLPNYFIKTVKSVLQSNWIFFCYFSNRKKKEDYKQIK